jgi:hypothetical protein
MFGKICRFAFCVLCCAVAMWYVVQHHVPGHLQWRLTTPEWVGVLCSLTIFCAGAPYWFWEAYRNSVQRAREAEAQRRDDEFCYGWFTAVTVQEASGRMAKGRQKEVERRQPLYAQSGGKPGAFGQQSGSENYGS